MKETLLKACLLVVVVSLAGGLTARAAHTEELATTILASERMPEAPRYRPPVAHAPKVRVDGRVRGTEDALLTLTVLAPEHVGLTTKQQPCLYWYQSVSAKTRFELTIMEPKAITPVLEARFNGSSTDAIQRICLDQYPVNLKPGIEYRWTIAMVLDVEDRSRDVVASGVIKRVAPPETLTKRLVGAPDSELPYIYADEGFWYDSLESLSNLIDKQPTKKNLYEVRAVYFMQAGLSEAARHEMKRAGVEGTVRPAADDAKTRPQ